MAIEQPDQARLARIARAASSDLLLLLDGTGHCRYASEASRALLGVEPDELLGHPFRERVHQGDLTGFDQALSDLDGDGPVAVLVRLRDREGAVRWCEAVLDPADTDLDDRAVAVAIRDISSRPAPSELRDQEALTDPLTGLANRSMLAEATRHALGRLDRGATHVGLLFLDVDHFKAINDAYGHRTGDRVLVAVADLLRRVVRPTDTVARLGGDEFVVLVEDIHDEHEVHTLAARLTESTRTPLVVDGNQVACTLSIGLAVTQDATSTLDELLHAADLAMYQAKQTGRDRVVSYDDRLHSATVDRQSRERTLRAAVAQDRLRLEFQPIVAIADGSLCAVEALVRVAATDGRLLLPRAFLPQSQDSGLLKEVDDWVMAESMRLASLWDGPLRALPISRNITARHLADPGFAGTLLEAAARHGLDPSCLAVEVTEQVLMRSSHSALAALREVRDAGVIVTLDHFGTGYSALGFLQTFPLDVVKLDRSRTRDIDTDLPGRQLASAVIDMCHALDLGVIAEGVERESQRAVLQDLGCERAQGWLWSHSGGVEAVEAYAADHGAPPTDWHSPAPGRASGTR